MQTNTSNSDQQVGSAIFQCSCKGIAGPHSLMVSALAIWVHQSDPPQRFTHCPHCSTLLYECPHCNTFTQVSAEAGYVQTCFACAKPFDDIPLGVLMNE